MGATVIDNVSQLKVSSQPKSGSPDGNIHFNTTTGELEIIIDSELPQVDFGSGPVDNPLTLDSKPTLRAIYELQQSEREQNEVFRQFRPFLIGRFKLGRAYDFIYGRTLGDDRTRIAQSGWREFGGERGVELNRIYFNVSTLVDVLPTSQVTYQLSENGQVYNFSRLGNVNEAIQVFGTTANGDTTANNFDTRDYLAVSLQTYGQRHNRLVLSDFGVNELEGYGTLAAIDESPHPTTNEDDYPSSILFGGFAVSPYSNIKFDVLSSPETKSGFNETDGDFSLIIRNASGASLDQVLAWIDQTNTLDIDIADTGVWNGLRNEMLYEFDKNGLPNFIPGIFIENLPVSDLQRIKLFDDAGAAKTFPFSPDLRVSLPLVAQNTTTGWYHAWVEDGSGDNDYNQITAVTMQDNLGNEIKGAIGASAEIAFGIAYDSFSLAGITPGTDFNIVMTISSDGEFEERTIVIPITRRSVITASFETIAENNI